MSLMFHIGLLSWDLLLQQFVKPPQKLAKRQLPQESPEEMLVARAGGPGSQTPSLQMLDRILSSKDLRFAT